MCVTLKFVHTACMVSMHSDGFFLYILSEIGQYWCITSRYCDHLMSRCFPYIAFWSSSQCERKCHQLPSPAHQKKRKRKVFSFRLVGGLRLTGTTGVHFKCHPWLQRFEYLPHFCSTPSATMKQSVEMSSWWGVGGGHQSVCFRERRFLLIGQQSSPFFLYQEH